MADGQDAHTNRQTDIYCSWIREGMWTHKYMYGNRSSNRAEVVYPAGHFAVSEPGQPSINVFELNKIPGMVDLAALKLRNVRSGFSG